MGWLIIWYCNIYVIWNIYCFKLSKESFNSDGQQFHQYQHYKRPLLSSYHWTQKRTMTYGIGNPRPGLYFILNCLCSTIANMLATTIRSNKDYKTDFYCFSTKHASLRNKSKDWWALNYDNMFAWKDMLTCNSVCWSRTKRTSSS